MRVISTFVHGLLDYGVALLLMALPFIFGFDHGGPAQIIPVALGVATVMYSLCTRYELGLIQKLPMRIHLALDLANGIFLAASPWLFGFAAQVQGPHLAVGLVECAVVALSRTEPSRSSSTRRTVHPTPEQLRSDIDHGRTGDKVNFPDPAAAPLGTDDEAAGTSIRTTVGAQARHSDSVRGSRGPA
jgi:hypothetical protein